MAKGFREQAAQPSVYQTISGTENTQDIRNVRNTQDTRDTVKQKYYRFNLKMPIEYEQYLKAAAYKASSPEKIVTITEYICQLIKDDMEKNK